MHSSLQIIPAQGTDLLSVDQLKAAWLRGERVEYGDPALARTSLPFQETYFPLGFPVTISTNCVEVLDAAAESWGTFTRMFDTQPIQINVGVTAGESHICPPTPVCRVRDHLSMNVADAENFAINDHALNYSMIWVTAAAVQHRDYFRYFFLDSSVLCDIDSRYATAVHAACVSFDGAGVLLCGESGAGKSTLSYACAKAGWTYVTDDGSYLVHDRDDRLVVGECSRLRFRPSAEELFPELHGRPVMQRAGVGKPSIELEAGEISGVDVSSTATVHKLVFLKRGVHTQELLMFPTAVAHMYMMQRVQCMPYLASVKETTIDQLLRLGACELRYNDLDWAVERLEQLAREGR